MVYEKDFFFFLLIPSLLMSLCTYVSSSIHVFVLSILYRRMGVCMHYICFELTAGNMFRVT